MNKTTLRALAMVLAGAILALPLAATPAPQGTKKKGAAAPQVKPADAKKGADELIDINSAPKEKLMTIKGIGDAYSDAIIKNRPYKRKDDLVAKKVLPQGVYDKVKDKIIAKQK